VQLGALKLWHVPSWVSQLVPGGLFSHWWFVAILQTSLQVTAEQAALTPVPAHRSVSRQLRGTSLPLLHSLIVPALSHEFWLVVQGVRQALSIHSWPVGQHRPPMSAQFPD
jgi:hypothetical protein